MEQITKTPGNNQLLYFTTSSLLDNDSGLVYISDGDGDVNLYYQDLATGEVRQLTHQKDGYLRSYVYFDGQPFKGLGKASVSLHGGTGNVYYIQGQQVMQVNAFSGKSKVICTLPEGQVTGFTHVDKDDQYLCIPTIDQSAFDVDQPYFTEIDRKVQREELCSYLRVFRIDNGEQILSEPVPRGWVTHVQFSPTDSTKILYNHEWCTDCGIRRMWLWDGKTHRAIRSEGDGSSADDWICHEMWEQDGEHIIYHGSRTANIMGKEVVTYLIGRVATDGSSRVEISLPEESRGYGHFTVGETDNLMITDGYYFSADDAKDNAWGGKWIAAVYPDWDNGTMIWQGLCRHCSSWDCQCSHPHPILDHAGKYAYFTSNPDGMRQVYRVPLNK